MGGELANFFYFSQNSVKSVLFSVFIISVASSLFWLFLTVVFGQRKYLASIYFLAFGLAFIGAVAGYAGGLSRTGAVGTIIPAALSLLGGVSVYLFGINKDRGQIATFSAIVFTTGLIFAYSLSSQKRVVVELRADYTNRCISLWDKIASGQDPQETHIVSWAIGDVCAYILAADITDVSTELGLSENSDVLYKDLHSGFARLFSAENKASEASQSKD